MSNTDDDIKYPVVSAPSRVEWLLVIILGVPTIALITIMGHETDPRRVWALVGLGGMVLVFCIPFVVRQLVYRIVADANGISWCTIGGANRANWSEVSNYYNEEGRVGERIIIRAVIVARETKVRFHSDWRNSSKLRAAVALSATNAVAHSWGFLGARDEDEWPQVFGYSEPNLKDKLRHLMLANTAIVIVFLLTAHEVYAKSMARDHEITLFTILAFAILIFLLGMMAVLLNAMLLPAYREFVRRKGQTITVDRETITFTDGASLMTARWAEVSDYYWTASSGKSLKRNDLGRIETPGGPICFHDEIDNRLGLAKIVERYAINTRQHEWRVKECYDSLEAAEPPSDQECSSRRYSYRNRSVRSLAALATFVPATPLFQHMFGILVARGVIEGALVLTTLTGYFWAVFLRSAIVIDDEAITKMSPFGQLSIRWDDVSEVKISSMECRLGTYVKSDRAKIAITGFESNVDDLLTEIERRAVNATIKRSE